MCAKSTRKRSTSASWSLIDQIKQGVEKIVEYTVKVNPNIDPMVWKKENTKFVPKVYRAYKVLYIYQFSLIITASISPSCTDESVMWNMSDLDGRLGLTTVLRGMLGYCVVHLFY